ncbi:MAG: hypothetical protein Q8O67_24735 [Deltaproteobacteria bacterium]|nr:hypothetical protein [Deltaproteobacteria bacterium]
MRAFGLLFVVVALVGSSACFTVNADLPGTLRGDLQPADYERIGDLKIEKGNWFFLWGLVGEPPADFFSKDIQKAVQAKGGDGVSNIKYESQEGCVDWGLVRCTFGLVAPRSYVITGDIVRIKKPPLAGKPAKVATSPAPNAPVVADAQEF